jgi:hypothetical protein
MERIKWTNDYHYLIDGYDQQNACNYCPRGRMIHKSNSSAGSMCRGFDVQVLYPSGNWLVQWRLLGFAFGRIYNCSCTGYRWRWRPDLSFQDTCMAYLDRLPSTHTTKLMFVCQTYGLWLCSGTAMSAHIDWTFFLSNNETCTKVFYI